MSREELRFKQLLIRYMLRVGFLYNKKYKSYNSEYHIVKFKKNQYDKSENLWVFEKNGLYGKHESTVYLKYYTTYSYNNYIYNPYKNIKDFYNDNMNYCSRYLPIFNSYIRHIKIRAMFQD